MRKIRYTVIKEGRYYVSQCLNVEVSSFGETIDEAIDNLTEALELYFEDNTDVDFAEIETVLVGEKTINV